MTLVLNQHPFASYCQKALIALYELDLPFDSHLVEGAEGRGVADARRLLDSAYGVLDTRLAVRPWAGGASFTVADCVTFPALFYLRAIHRWDTDARANITRYYGALLARPSIARVVEEARPFREVFPLPWPADQDELGP